MIFGTKYRRKNQEKGKKGNNLQLIISLQGRGGKDNSSYSLISHSEPVSP